VVTFGWNLSHSAQDELFSAIEGTAFHTRVILERMERNGVPIQRVVNAGGIPQKNDVLNRVYANVLNKPVLIPQSDVTSVGSAIFAALAAGAFPSVEAAQEALCPKYRVVEPDAKAAKVYEELYGLYRELYFGLGKSDASAVSVGHVLPTLRRVAAAARGNA
jgi:L-ribulokinase